MKKRRGAGGNAGIESERRLGRGTIWNAGISQFASNANYGVFCIPFQLNRPLNILLSSRNLIVASRIEERTLRIGFGIKRGGSHF
jgi:hypothetical protein